MLWRWWTQLFSLHYSSCVCLGPNLEPAAPVVLTCVPEDPSGPVLVIGRSWGCGFHFSQLLLLTDAAVSRNHLALGFQLRLHSFSLLLFLCLSLFCWVMCRHRGYSEARWEGHNDLCILLLSRLLWRTEGELLTLQTHINLWVQQRKIVKSPQFPSDVMKFYYNQLNISHYQKMNLEFLFLSGLNLSNCFSFMAMAGLINGTVMETAANTFWFFCFWSLTITCISFKSDLQSGLIFSFLFLSCCFLQLFWLQISTWSFHLVIL